MMISLRKWVFVASTLPLLVVPAKAEPDPQIERLVKETHAASLAQREQALRGTIAKEHAFPSGAWGDTLWCLSALHLNERTDEANARLLKRAQAYIDLNRTGAKLSKFIPEGARETPWTYFGLADYVRILHFFHAASPHFPGRLTPETEAAMKEALWFWVRKDSRLEDAGPDDIYLLIGTENHDLTHRPNHYLVTALLAADPEYRDRKLEDGHTVAEHAAAYTTYFRAWPWSRAGAGLWVELGSDTYQKYSWPALFNLHELAPDPRIRTLFGRLLDLALVEEAQISVKGRRGGGRSRAEKFGANAFEKYKDVLYGKHSRSPGSSHSRIIETSRYLPPPEAILLRLREFPADQPFVIRNRVLGEMAKDKAGALEPDSSLVNYAYRSPHFLLGSTLMNPAPQPQGRKELRSIYAGISRQNRWCGMLFEGPSAREISAIFPVIDENGQGRPQNSFWMTQHLNALVLQRIAPESRTRPGSYNTGAIAIRFQGTSLTKVERDGWIFATNGKAHAAVKFLDGPHRWDAAQREARPADFDRANDRSRVLIHADDASRLSFERFQSEVLGNPLQVNAAALAYGFNAGTSRLEVTSYDATTADQFRLPRMDGQPLDLHSAKAYSSPDLNGDFGSQRISITVPPFSRVLDFSPTPE